METYIFTNSLYSIYVLRNPIKSPSFQSNHHDKLLIAYIINTIKNSHHRFTIQKVHAHTNITGNEEVHNFAKQGVDTPHIISTPFHLFGHQTPYWPSIPPTSTQQDGSICNLKRYIEKEHVSAIVSQTTNTLSHAYKRLSNTDLHFKWSNLLWDTPWITNAQITQAFKIRYDKYLGNYFRKHFLK